MIKALAITGPTASGKTALSLNIAESFGCEIISCDSMQIYKGMDIGTAKATADEQSRVKHHLIDIVSPTENYSAESYRNDALMSAEQICDSGMVPLFVGGTGLYIDTVMRPASHASPESDPEYRERILAEIKTDKDKAALWSRLYSVDPASAEVIHQNNVKRVIRALEIYEKTGVPKSVLDKRALEGVADISVGMITLDFHDRENLYRRVDKRVDAMMEEGLYDEVLSLYNADLLREKSTAAQAIGYKEIISAIKGECTINEAKEMIKLATRRYAKRQLTWFRHESEAYRLYMDREDGSVRALKDILGEAHAFCKQFLSNQTF
ncbi:MAG: tRNA (adenosine(37)-N6)-dimethylallyltransferase MiaA [Clostridia bacterium]|nr:tRNA (adenosine(37)-N6)-dimethylallyltransferase MiaA [Clostridia bacterium]